MGSSKEVMGLGVNRVASLLLGNDFAMAAPLVQVFYGFSAEVFVVVVQLIGQQIV